MRLQSKLSSYVQSSCACFMDARRRCLALLLVPALLSACSGTLTGPGTPRAVLPKEQQIEPKLPVRAATGDAAIDAANAAYAAAYGACDAVKQSIPRQKSSRQKRAFNRKQSGLLVTTLVGAGGSIVSVVLSATGADEAGKVGSNTPTVIGAVTAGATSVAGVVSLLVVGAGVEDEINILDAADANTQQLLADLEAKCAAIDAATAGACRIQAEKSKTSCCNIESNLYYDIAQAGCPSP